MNLKQYVVDAFTDTVFKGNPAAVCILDQVLSDGLMQRIAAENNLSETAFAGREGNHYTLRWFTPGGTRNQTCARQNLAPIFRHPIKEEWK